jgi:hypothetical protein
MHPIQDLFLKSFSYVLQIDIHFICTPMWTKFYSCKKWVLQAGPKDRGGGIGLRKAYSSKSATHQVTFQPTAWDG